MTIRKIRFRWAYDLASTTLILGFTYIILFHGDNTATDLIEVLIIFAIGSSCFFRAYYLDRLRRIKTDKELVDIWLYNYEAFSIKRLITTIAVYPLKVGDNQGKNLKLLTLINIFTYLTYVFVICLVFLEFQFKS